MKKYYDALEIPYGSSKEIIKKAFRNLATKYHPDRVGGDAEKFKNITQAYSELMKNSSPENEIDSYHDSAVNTVRKMREEQDRKIREKQKRADDLINRVNRFKTVLKEKKI